MYKHILVAIENSDADVTILDDVGHYPMIESPAAFAAAVTAHL